MFDPSAPHIIILLAVVLLLFGSTRLPGAAKALGSSMRIFKREMKDMHDDDEAGAASSATAQPGTLPPAQLPPPVTQAPQQVAAPVGATQQQVEDLQRQIAELRRQTAGLGGVTGEPAQAPRDQSL